MAQSRFRRSMACPERTAKTARLQLEELNLLMTLWELPRASFVGSVVQAQAVTKATAAD